MWRTPQDLQTIGAVLVNLETTVTVLMAGDLFTPHATFSWVFQKKRKTFSCSCSFDKYNVLLTVAQAANRISF